MMRDADDGHAMRDVPIPEGRCWCMVMVLMMMMMLGVMMMMMLCPPSGSVDDDGGEKEQDTHRLFLEINISTPTQETIYIYVFICQCIMIKTREFSKSGLGPQVWSGRRRRIRKNEGEQTACRKRQETADESDLVKPGPRSCRMYVFVSL